MEYYYWILTSLCFFILEVIAPIAYFLWIAVASIAISIVVYLLDIGIIHQAILFSLLVPLITILGRIFCPINIHDHHVKNINNKLDQMIGKKFTTEEAIVKGRLQMKIGETIWLLKGPDLPAGTEVEVVDIDNNFLIVKPCQK